MVEKAKSIKTKRNPSIKLGLLAKIQNKEEIDKKAKKLMKETGIYRLAEKSITDATQEQLQWAGICRALINSPDILFADEPTGAVNPEQANDIMDVIHKINSMGTTVLLATHNIKAASRSERILFMKDGGISDEYHFSKSENDLKEREVKLSEWLRKMDF